MNEMSIVDRLERLMHDLRLEYQEYIELREIRYEVERLQNENAALRKQISEMVMPPCTLGDTLYIVACTFGDGYVENEIVHQSGFSVVKSVVTEKNFYKMCDLVRNGKAFFSRESALARLAELKGGSNDR